MRTIKFRGKSDFTDKFIFGDLVRNLDGRLAIIPPFKNGMDNHCEKYEVDPNTLGQFTGLKDNNGTEIYEGDIVNIDRMANKYNVISKVEYVSSSFKVKDMWPLSKYAGKCEVIGNIYDNPELLNK